MFTALSGKGGAFLYSSGYDDQDFLQSINLRIVKIESSYYLFTVFNHLPVNGHTSIFG